MPAAIDTQVKIQVISQWLSGDSRDRIAADNDIGPGTVRRSSFIGPYHDTFAFKVTNSAEGLCL
jgi:hypothetical protein